MTFTLLIVQEFKCFIFYYLSIPNTLLYHVPILLMYVYIIIIPNETLPSFTNYQLLILSLHGTHLRQTSETKDRHGPCSRELDRCPPSPNPRVL